MNKGTLIIDATCTPADIAFPIDLEFCDKARTWTEIILDHYWKLLGSAYGEKKPRTYRKVARRRYLTLAKRRRKSAKKRSEKSFGYQLGCIHRNLEYIDVYASEYGLDCLHKSINSASMPITKAKHPNLSRLWKKRKRFVHYPERYLADKIYRRKSNRAFCKDHGINLSSPKLLPSRKRSFRRALSGA